MAFKIDDRVVYPALGIGRVVGLVVKRLVDAGVRQYYEVSLGKNTVWVPVDAGAGSGLRPLTSRADLARYRDVLRGCPRLLTPDHRQRDSDLRTRLQAGSFQDFCEVVRDLTARAWQKPLGEKDSASLRKGRDAVCQEWAATDGVSVTLATAEVNALLLEGRENHQA